MAIHFYILLYLCSMAYELITILGPTASGKTVLAVALAADLDTEIISADSRQVYRGMTLGTGKDLKEYVVEGKQIPYHLIDICNPGEKYNIFQFQRNFHEVFESLKAQRKIPVLCGGSGLYIESVLKGYKLLDVPENPALRENLKDKSLNELETILRSYKKLHNKTEIDSAQRAIRAIEIEEFYLKQNPEQRDYEPINSLITGVNIDRDLRRGKISHRLKSRLEEGMLDEVKGLLDSGISAENLIYYGLEYKYLTLHLTGKITYKEMYDQLEIAIHQFAKRQMTWFRGMERRGLTIHWINAEMPLQEKIETVKKLYAKR